MPKNSLISLVINKGVITAFFLAACPLLLLAQLQPVKGKVIDARSGEPMPSVSIVVYQSGKLKGTVSNREGMFSVSARTADSMRFSIVGYQPRTLSNLMSLPDTTMLVAMEVHPAELDEVVVKPMTALEIVKAAIKQLPVTQPAQDFETSGFYREIIKDHNNYFSVAEALFAVQFFPDNKDYRLKLLKGRTKEDVSFTKLFEDYHPGGGPQAAIKNSFLVNIPAFLKSKELKKFDLKKEPLTNLGNKNLYVISFDQKPGIKEALEKGLIYIDADDFSIVKYSAETSPTGAPYIKHLTGKDKIFANLLNIDFKQKGWKREVGFLQVNGKSLLNHANLEYNIAYKQPRKNIDLDLTLSLELLIEPEENAISNTIAKDEEWKRSDLVKNLPFSFDPAYWGNASTIVPTQQISDVLDAITAKNNLPVADNETLGWNKLNDSLFVSYSTHDSIVLIPIAKSEWGNLNTGPLLYKEVESDFTIEAKLFLSKNTDVQTGPDRGFQQCGIIIRPMSAEREENVFLSFGTSGNKNVKLNLTQTTAGKSKSTTKDVNGNLYWLRLERKNGEISAYYKNDSEAEWKLIKSYNESFHQQKLQVGLICFAHFPGKGPKMYPDVRGVFTDIKLINEQNK